MSWYYNDVTGQVFEETGAGAVAQNANDAIGSASGWLVGDKTYGPYATQAQAQAAKTANPPTGLTKAVDTVGSVVSNGLNLPTLSNLRDLVMRSVKVIIGALLIIVGVNSLLKNEGISVPKPPAVIPV
jgi:hypothetical protein